MSKVNVDQTKEVESPQIQREEMELVKTGIEGLDEIIGGLIKGRTYLVAGETGTGKTLFALNFLVYGALNNEPGIYLLVDEDYEDFIKGARAFGWDLEYLIDQDKLSILTLLPDFVERMKNKSLDSIVKSIVYNLGSEARRIGAKRLVIDPVAPLVLSESELGKMREYIRSLIINLEKQVGTTNIITSEIPTGSNKLSRYDIEEFLAAGVFVLRLERIGNKYIRTILIRKMRWRPVHPELYTFSIASGRGIVLGRKL
ncbi:MAG: recombinase RecA [Thermoprotei archaeon]|nr:MAG: recombinase RecA [Thermoprotei archaeon]